MRWILPFLAVALVASACAAAQVQESALWHLDRIDQRELPLDGEYRYRTTGEGVRIHIVDDGVRDHDDFAPRLATGLRLHGGEPSGDHGTRAAGAAAGSVHGVAKGATVVDVHAYADPPDDPDLAGLTRQAYEWIAAEHSPDERGVVVNAWGLTDDEGVVEAVRALLDEGICVVLSAGNLDEEVGRPGALPLPDPERNPEMIVVGATNAADERWSDSSYGRNVDVYAPGQDLTLPSGDNDETADATSGTSWAAPIVAGVVARMLEDDPDLTCGQVKDRLLDQATSGVITGLPEGSHNRLVHAPDR